MMNASKYRLVLPDEIRKTVDKELHAAPPAKELSKKHKRYVGRRIRSKQASPARRCTCDIILIW